MKSFLGYLSCNRRWPLRDVAYEYFDKQPNKHITVVAVAAFGIWSEMKAIIFSTHEKQLSLTLA